eukprot:scaffold223607_cov26-Prasinocladus_malaysianus.AAC.1
MMAATVPSINVTLELLGETESHAWLLANNLDAALETGDLYEDMKARGFAYEVDMAVVDISVVDAGMAPQYYPPGDNAEEITYSRDFEEVAVVLEESAEKGGALPGYVIYAAAGGGGLALVLAVVATIVCMKKRSRKDIYTGSKTPRTPKTPKSSLRPSGESAL